MFILQSKLPSNNILESCSVLFINSNKLASRSHFCIHLTHTRSQHVHVIWMNFSILFYVVMSLIFVSSRFTYRCLGEYSRILCSFLLTAFRYFFHFYNDSETRSLLLILLSMPGGRMLGQECRVSKRKLRTLLSLVI